MPTRTSRSACRTFSTSLKRGSNASGSTAGGTIASTETKSPPAAVASAAMSVVAATTRRAVEADAAGAKDCAPAASGQAAVGAAAPARSVMNRRRLMSNMGGFLPPAGDHHLPATDLCGRSAAPSPLPRGNRQVLEPVLNRSGSRRSANGPAPALPPQTIAHHSVAGARYSAGFRSLPPELGPQWVRLGL